MEYKDKYLKYKKKYLDLKIDFSGGNLPTELGCYFKLNQNNTKNTQDKRSASLWYKDDLGSTLSKYECLNKRKKELKEYYGVELEVHYNESGNADMIVNNREQLVTQNYSGTCWAETVIFTLFYPVQTRGLVVNSIKTFLGKKDKTHLNKLIELYQNNKNVLLKEYNEAAGKYDTDDAFMDVFKQWGHVAWSYTGRLPTVVKLFTQLTNDKLYWVKSGFNVSIGGGYENIVNYYKACTNSFSDLIVSPSYSLELEIYNLAIKHDKNIEERNKIVKEYNKILDIFKNKINEKEKSRKESVNKIKIDMDKLWQDRKKDESEIFEKYKKDINELVKKNDDSFSEYQKYEFDLNKKARRNEISDKEANEKIDERYKIYTNGVNKVNIDIDKLAEERDNINNNKHNLYKKNAENLNENIKKINNEFNNYYKNEKKIKDDNLEPISKKLDEYDNKTKEIKSKINENKEKKKKEYKKSDWLKNIYQKINKGKSSFILCGSIPEDYDIQLKINEYTLVSVLFESIERKHASAIGRVNKNEWIIFDGEKSGRVHPIIKEKDIFNVNEDKKNPFKSGFKENDKNFKLKGCKFVCLVYIK
jgi:hypothetical protein